MHHKYNKNVYNKCFYLPLMYKKMMLIYKLTVGTPSLQDLSPNINFILPIK